MRFITLVALLRTSVLAQKALDNAEIDKIETWKTRKERETNCRRTEKFKDAQSGNEDYTKWGEKFHLETSVWLQKQYSIWIFMDTFQWFHFDLFIICYPNNQNDCHIWKFWTNILLDNSSITQILVLILIVNGYWHPVLSTEFRSTLRYVEKYLIFQPILLKKVTWDQVRTLRRGSETSFCLYNLISKLFFKILFNRKGVFRKSSNLLKRHISKIY